MYTQKRVERYISLSFCPEEEESCVQLIGVDRKKKRKRTRTVRYSVLDVGRKKAILEIRQKKEISLNSVTY